MTTYTHVTSMIDALVALFKAAMPELDANGGILDGPPTTAIPNDYAAVGFNPGTVARPQVAAVHTRQDLSELIDNAVTEHIEVFCQISTFSGDPEVSVTRNRTLTYFNELSTQLAADRSLGGVIPLPGKAEIAATEWYIEQGDDILGTQVSIVFQIVGDVWFM